jgi:hypothetical protein
MMLREVCCQCLLYMWCLCWQGFYQSTAVVPGFLMLRNVVHSELRTSLHLCLVGAPCSNLRNLYQGAKAQFAQTRSTALPDDCSRV